MKVFNEYITEKFRVSSEMLNTNGKKAFKPKEYFALRKTIELLGEEALKNNLSILDCTSIDVSNVHEFFNTTNLMGIFENNLPTCITTIDVTGWNTKNVTNMACTFFNCRNIEQIIGLETWDITKVLNINNMFRRCYKLKDVGNISHWQPIVDKIDKKTDVFFGCNSLNKKPFEY